MSLLNKLEKRTQKKLEKLYRCAQAKEWATVEQEQPLGTDVDYKELEYSLLELFKHPEWNTDYPFNDEQQLRTLVELYYLDYFAYIKQPLIKVLIEVDREGATTALAEMCGKIALEPEDLFDAVHGDQETATSFFEKLHCEESERGSLLAAIHDKSSFCTLVKQAEIDLSPLAGDCLHHELYIDIEIPSDENHLIQHFDNIVSLFKNLIPHSLMDDPGLEDLKRQEELIHAIKAGEPHESVLEKIFQTDAKFLKDTMSDLEAGVYPAPVEILIRNILDRDEGKVALNYLLYYYKSPQETSQNTAEHTNLQLVYDESYVSLDNLKDQSRETTKNLEKIKKEEKLGDIDTIRYYDYDSVITRKINNNQFDKEYEDVRRIYEKFVLADYIDHTAENFNAFMYRMTGKHKAGVSPSSFIRIPWKAEMRILYYWIGHLVIPSVPPEKNRSKKYNPRGTWQRTHLFFDPVNDSRHSQFNDNENRYASRYGSDNNPKNDLDTKIKHDVRSFLEGITAE